MRLPCPSLAIGLLMYPVLLGCEKSAWERVPLRGKVLLNGEPVSGEISFVPVRGTSGPASSTSVAQGRYGFAKQRGPVSGSHQVVLSWADFPRNSQEPQVEVEVPATAPFVMDLAFEFNPPQSPGTQPSETQTTESPSLITK